MLVSNSNKGQENNNNSMNNNFRIKKGSIGSLAPVDNLNVNVNVKSTNIKGK